MGKYPAGSFDEQFWSLCVPLTSSFGVALTDRQSMRNYPRQYQLTMRTRVACCFDGGSTNGEEISAPISTNDANAYCFDGSVNNFELSAPIKTNDVDNGKLSGKLEIVGN